jgi:NADPH2:quinone reductase
MTSAIRVHRYGGPDVLEWERRDPGDPGPGEVRIAHDAVGLNFIDVYHRTGRYPEPLPFTPGVEGAGVVEAVGAGVSRFAVGDRVAYVDGPLGAYCEARLLPADRAIHLPDSVSAQTAAALMLRGMTAYVLVRRVYRVQAGDAILVHAAAGGMGAILCEWATSLGATVIGTVSRASKVAFARSHGCAHPIVTADEDFVTRVREITDGRGVAVVYDSIGKDTLLPSIDCLRPLGHLVSYGQSSGAPAPIEVGLLARKGSLSLTRPMLFHFIVARSDLETAADAVFRQLAAGHVSSPAPRAYALSDVAQAHRDLEARTTTGSSVLLVHPTESRTNAPKKAGPHAP